MADYITREQQEEMGLLKPARGKFVQATLPPPSLPVQTSHTTALDVTPSAQQYVVVQTSATDRAKGYTITLVPLAAVLALLAVVVRVTLFDHPFLTAGTLLVFWGSFAVCWLVGWIVTLVMTPEFVSLYEARRKWNIVENEQKERWSHWRWQTGRDSE